MLSRPRRHRVSAERDRYRRGWRLIFYGIDLVRHPPRNDIEHAAFAAPRFRPSARVPGAADCGLGDLLLSAISRR
jgi:hypothetical protein